MRSRINGTACFIFQKSRQINFVLMSPIAHKLLELIPITFPKACYFDLTKDAYIHTDICAYILAYIDHRP